jgi:arginase
MVIGVASGCGARDPGCQDSPEVLRQMGFLRDLEQAGNNFCWDGVIHLSDEPERGAVDAVAEISARVAQRVIASLAAGAFPLVIGGDHACAIGTWSGVYASMAKPGRLGLIWLDAHMDSHTPRTTPSNAIHGMPLACLLGHGDARLTGIVAEEPKLRPEDVCLIGVRSFESGEQALLRRLGVRIYLMEEVRARGFAEVLCEARKHVAAHTAGYGISLDLDVLDPAEEPGVGTPVPGGILRRDMIKAMQVLQGDGKLLAMEIVEYNPYRDQRFETARAVHDLCQSVVRLS